MSAGNQARRCSGSVMARHTLAGGWARSRLKRSSQRSPTLARAPTSGSVSMSFLLARFVGHGVEMAFEGVEAGGPQAAVRIEPLVEVAEGLGPGAVDAALGIDADLDQAGGPQHPQVLGHRRLAQGQRGDEVADGPLGGT